MPSPCRTSRPSKSGASGKSRNTRLWRCRALRTLMSACCTGREYARGYGKNFTTLIESRVGCDECSTSWGGFGNHDAKRKAGDEMVAGRKVSGFGPDAQGKGCEQCALS